MIVKDVKLNEQMGFLNASVVLGVYVCSDMQLLFVHAGFVSNLRLSKQHPRFMINMRSILADGTVSARYAPTRCLVLAPQWNSI